MPLSSSGDVRIYSGGYDPEDERLRITSGGNVGIGTVTPDEKFEVEFGNSNIDVEIGQGTTDTDVTFITLRSPNGTKYYLTVNDSGGLIISTTHP